VRFAVSLCRKAASSGKLRSDEVPDQRTVCKVNMSAQQALRFYDLFLESCKAAGETALPGRLDDSALRPVVVAQLSCGRLYNKLLTSDLSKTLIGCFVEIGFCC